MSVNNGWTGGQYSIFRALFGGYLLIHFLQLIPWGAEVFSNQGVLPEASASPLLHLMPNLLALWDQPTVVTGFLIAGAILSVLFAAGSHDRVAALLLWYVWACLFGRNPLIANPSLPFVGWMLLAHVFLPAAPYGSWAARGRIDPACEWRMPQPIYRVAWIILALSYTYSGYTKLISPSWIDGTAMARILDNPLARPTWLRDAILTSPAWVLQLATWGGLTLELAFAPLALFRRARPWIWGLMLLMHVSLIMLIDFADLSASMILMHFFTWDPAWAPPRPGATERIFYDGHCGLCHRAVRLILAEDRSGMAFRFAPLGGETFLAAVPEADRRALPDTVVVQTREGALLTRSAAVLHILGRLGGLWCLLGAVGHLVPAPVRDWGYDRLAAVRHRLFAPPPACPLMPARYRERFDI
jgi:predicted DCC family thiol-disulfide oxidoreductase YuxK